MTDAHCHVSCGDPSVRELLCGRDFVGVHPWDAEGADVSFLHGAIAADQLLGVGEIGLDRLRSREISADMRRVFEEQLAIAAESSRPVVLHGAKCWGEVVSAAKRHVGRIPAFLFHGFSRSWGLLGEIAAIGGFVSVGPAVLNGHAANYRRAVTAIPAEMLLVETDRTAESAAECPPVAEVLREVAALRGDSPSSLEELVDSNADRFLAGPHT